MSFTPRATPGRPTEMLAPLSAEQRFWLARLSWLLAPRDGRAGALARTIAWITVVPLTNLTPLSLDYQAYLNRIFHRSALARIGHSICIPSTVFWLLAAVAQLAGATAAAVVTAAFALWYVAWAALERSALWGAASVAVVAAMGVGAAAWRDVAVGGAWWTSALPWMCVSAFVQAMSHAGEPDLPPRMNGTSEWIPFGAFVRGRAAAAARQPLALRLARIAGHFACGPFDEWMASPRLLPVYVLELLHALGYQRGRRDAGRDLAARSLAVADPALDYIGTGGGTFLERA